ALQAAEKGYRRIMEANATLQGLQHPGGGKAGALDQEIKDLIDSVYDEMNDDFNTPRALARMFELVTKINALKGGQLSFGDILPETLEQLQQSFRTFLFDVFGLKDEMET
ncbi:DALR domain-containing protein, partial [Arthrospira platensis SPKY1]|nr:DALR domain-containing protein [Arthrospira platensis SPKY1]